MTTQATTCKPTKAKPARRKPAKAAQNNGTKLIPYEERGTVFADFSPERWTRYQTLLADMAGCRSYSALEDILLLATAAEQKVRTLLADREAEKQSPTLQWLNEFGFSDVFDDLTALRVNVRHAAGVIDSILPKVKTTRFGPVD